MARSKKIVTAISQLTEAQIQRQILDWLKAEHILAFRNNVLAMPTADGKRFIKAGTPGMADILAFWEPAKCPICHYNMGCYDICGEAVSCDQAIDVPVWIEVKGPKGKQSELQASFQEQVESHGHKYVLARSLEDVISVIGREMQ